MLLKKASKQMTTVIVILTLLLTLCSGLASAEAQAGAEPGGDGNVPPTVVSLTADKAITMNVGASRTVRITAHMSDNTTSDVTSIAQWSTSDASVVSVTGSGTLTAAGPGTATLTAALNSLSISIAVTVSQPAGGDGGSPPPPTPPTVLSLTADKAITMTVGASRTVRITAHMSDNTTTDATSIAQWSTSNASVVSVTGSGTLTAAGPGTATLTAALNSLSISIAVTVSQPAGGDGGSPTPPTPPTVVSLTADKAISMTVGASRTVHITAHMSDNTTTDATSIAQWSTSNASVVSVTSTGTLTAAGPGTATLTAALNNLSISIAVTVSQPAGGDGGSPTPPPPSPPILDSKPEPAQESEQLTFKKGVVDADALKAEVKNAIETAPAVTFNDVPSTSWSSKSVALAAQVGFVEGYGDGTFHADASVTRAEFASMLVKGLGIEAKSTDSFADVHGHWAEAAIQALKSNGIIGGYAEGTFKPNNEISRAEIAAILSKVMNLSLVTESSKFLDVSGSWAEQSINQLANAGILSGKGSNKFDPNATASRAESVTMILRVLNVNLNLGLQL
ncbi:S-layer homology domain-containing protein [Paenibacillus sp. R14(2021)]|uniref:S-layer homology domain-containing protein n=1 Tax=Paenibacillus sp. R14(2021) TaxID=2859228 RepID=UPI001C6137F2|nr:S-layer homology domain-containing protein [Paenibacillus sp. R14(2021)]